MNTYGIEPSQHYRLFEHEGYQVLAEVTYDDDDGCYNVELTGYIPALEATSVIKFGCPTEEVAMTVFNGMGEEGGAEAVITGWLDQVGPAVQAMIGDGELPDDYSLSKVEFEDGTVLSVSNPE